MHRPASLHFTITFSLPEAKGRQDRCGRRRGDRPALDAAKEGVDFSVSDGAGAVAEFARSGCAAAFPRRTRRRGWVSPTSGVAISTMRPQAGAGRCRVHCGQGRGGRFARALGGGFAARNRGERDFSEAGSTVGALGPNAPSKDLGFFDAGGGRGNRTPWRGERRSRQAGPAPCGRPACRGLSRAAKPRLAPVPRRLPPVRPPAAGCQGLFPPGTRPEPLR